MPGTDAGCRPDDSASRSQACGDRAVRRYSVHTNGIPPIGTEMTIMTASTTAVEHMSTEQDWSDGVTRIWYEVDGESWGVCVGAMDERTVLDCDGAPADLGMGDARDAAALILPLVDGVMADAAT